MHSAVAVVALAAGALAVPYKRDVVTDYDVVYVTDVVTVTAVASAAAESTTAAPSSSSVEVDAEASSFTSASVNAHYGHHNWGWYAAQASSAEDTSSSVYVAPTPSSTSVYVAPTPSSTSVYVAPTTSSSVYVAPTPSSTSVYVAPTPSSTSVYVAPPAPTTSTYVAPPAPASTSSSEDPTSATLPANPQYSDFVVYHHNIHRFNHSAPAISWDADLANSAQDIANSCVYAHNVDADGGGYGQNIAAGVGSDNISAVITDLFYNGEVNWFADLYGQDQPDMTNFESYGHFTQIVWAETTHVGCATQHCTNGLGNVGSDVAPYFTVCNYKNPGNFANEYAKNVFSPLNRATAEWNSGMSW